MYDGQGSDGFEFLANNMLSYYEFRPTEKFHKNRPELIFPIKYLGVAFWPEANYEEELKKIIIYFVNHRDKGFTARKITVWLKANPRTINIISSIALIIIAVIAAFARF